MYRLLGLRSVPLHNVRIAAIQVNPQKIKQTCSHCKFHHPKEPVWTCCMTVRSQTTGTSTALMDTGTKKKIKRRLRKYAELLEVTGESTTDTKAAVKKLKPDQLSLLMDNPDITLDNFHKIQKRSKKAVPDFIEDVATESEHATEREHEMSVLEDLAVSGLTDKSTLIKNAALLESLQEENHNDLDEDGVASLGTTISSAKPTKKRTTKKKNLSKQQMELSAKNKLADLARKGKAESLSRSLHVYLDLCVSCGMVSRGLSTLAYYRSRACRNMAPRFMNITLYNILLHGFAEHGKLLKVKELLQMIAEDSIHPEPQTYAAVFECVARMPDAADHKGFLETIASEMTEKSITLNDIMDKSTFIADQREMTLKAIKILSPKFQALYTPPDLSYTCHLLEKISSTEGALSNPAEGMFTVQNLRDKAKRQLELEINGEVSVKSIERMDEPTPSILHYRKKLADAEAAWRQTVLEAFQRDLKSIRSQHYGGNGSKTITLYPYLIVLDAEQYVEIILREIRHLAEGSETFSASIGMLIRNIGSQIFHKYQVRMQERNGALDKVTDVYSKYTEWYLTRPDGSNSRSAWQRLKHESEHIGASLDAKQPIWPTTVCKGLGRFLYNIILRDVKIDVNCIRFNSKSERHLPAFYSLFRCQGRQIKEEIKPHPVLARLYRDSQLQMLTFDTALLPTLCPPVPWSNVHSGGYLIAKSDIIRLPQHAIQQKQRLETTPQQQLYPCLDSLNQLGSIPWRVNIPVLDVATHVFQNGGSAKLDVPEPPSVIAPLPACDPSAPKEERFKIMRARLAQRRRKAEMYSLWCDALYRLSLANHYRDEIFWLPHSMDFRGRVYPIPPHLNHLGADLARSILVFALGKPLGPEGLDWLKIHVVNLTGLKKRDPVNERLAYANEILPKIIDSAEKPLTGEMWWQTSEEPWQTLAACIEIAAALKAPNPAEYISQFPVHQDGSCNGLQHYAALGRDKKGAESVNLAPATRPQDVYSAVAALVEKERIQDAENGVKVAQVLDGFIKRKVIKQTVMTTVYGVTRFGARLQIARQLKDIDKFPREFVWSASTYLVGKTFLSLGEMFTSSREIQDWFTECARLVCQVCGENMEWITPLGLPVVQPYNRTMKRIDGVKLDEHFPMDMFERPNVMKQKNAFPPNFIHSLDSSHMMLTSLHCEHAGLTFISVHDCFWTHPSTVHIMNKICREQFVALHSEPILEDLSQFLVEKFGYKKSELKDDGSVVDVTKHRLNRVLVKLPNKGTFDIDGVLSSVYFFS